MKLYVFIEDVESMCYDTRVCVINEQQLPENVAYITRSEWEQQGGE